MLRSRTSVDHACRGSATRQACVRDAHLCRLQRGRSQHCNLQHQSGSSVMESKLVCCRHHSAQNSSGSLPGYYYFDSGSGVGARCTGGRPFTLTYGRCQLNLGLVKRALILCTQTPGAVFGDAPGGTDYQQQYSETPVDIERACTELGRQSGAFSFSLIYRDSVNDGSRTFGCKILNRALGAPVTSYTPQSLDIILSNGYTSTSYEYSQLYIQGTW